jgi:hypothetical protein
LPWPCLGDGETSTGSTFKLRHSKNHFIPFFFFYLGGTHCCFSISPFAFKALKFHLLFKRRQGMLEDVEELLQDMKEEDCAQAV